MTLLSSLRLAFSAMLAVASISAANAVGNDDFIDIARVRSAVDGNTADPIVGIWQLDGDNASFAVIPRTGARDFIIALVDSPDMSAIPGSVIGHLKPTGKPGTYDAAFVESTTLRKRTHRFILTLDADGRLVFTSYSKGHKLSLWRLIPYMFRVSVLEKDTRPNAIDAAVRVYPVDNSSKFVVL